MSDAQAVNTANDVLDLDKQPHDRSDTDLLYRIYLEKRIASQTSFYESRVKENQFNADFTFTAGAFVMTLSSLIATISASAGASPYLSLLSAILPAFAALLGAFRQLYGWERQINIYRDSLLGLERVQLVAPDDDRLPVSDIQKIYPELVTSSETVFTGEVNQWGQFILEKDKGTADNTSDAQAMTALIGELDLTDDQRSIIAAVLSSGKKSTSTNLLASVSTSTVVTATTTTTNPPNSEAPQVISAPAKPAASQNAIPASTNTPVTSQNPQNSNQRPETPAKTPETKPTSSDTTGGVG